MVAAPTETRTRIPLGRLEGGAEAFAFLRDHYAIYPWLIEGSAIGRVLEVHDVPIRVVIKLKSDDTLEATAPSRVTQAQRPEIAATLRFCFALDEPDPLQALAADDPVIAAARAANPGLRPKRYPTLWEAVCGAICAQNVDFRRLYTMMKNLCRALGAEAEGEHAFPAPQRVVEAGEESLRTCRIGYRARALEAAATWWLTHGEGLDRNALRAAPQSDARGQLEQIPFIGPYSAAIVLAAGCGRSDVFQLDSFTRTILRTFYFDGAEVADEALRSFVANRWPDVGGAVAHLLTTNTEVWADALGRPDFRRSGARAAR